VGSSPAVSGAPHVVDQVERVAARRAGERLGPRHRDPHARLVPCGPHLGHEDLVRLDSVERLTEAPAAFRGTILVASHDVPFLRRIGCTRWWSVDGGLHELAHPGRR
jgi:hypothetical protein